jgi:thiol-disulfide isomerase/thioredoxin
MMKPLFNILIWVAAGVVLAIVLFSFMQPSLSEVKNPGNQTAPANITPPANTTLPPQINESGVDLMLIDANECQECINGTAIMEEIGTYLDNLPNIKVSSATTIERSGPEAQALIEQYNITQIPVLIVRGEADYPDEFISTWQKKVGTREPDGSFVSRLIPPPYFSVGENRVVGIVSGVAIRPYGCPDCADPAGFFFTLEDPAIGRVYFTEKIILDENSTEAQQLIAKYNLTRLPTVMVDSEIQRYPVFSQILNLNKTDDGWFIVRDVKPPYVDLAANHTVRGLVEAILIVNSSCGDCLDINQLSDAIVSPNGMKAITLVNKTIYEADSPEAQALIKKYGITAIPTVLYSPEIAVYPGFESYWKQENSTVESDGWFVFRSHALTSLTYQNISG